MVDIINSSYFKQFSKIQKVAFYGGIVFCLGLIYYGIQINSWIVIFPMLIGFLFIYRPLYEVYQVKKRGYIYD